MRQRITRGRFARWLLLQFDLLEDLLNHRAPESRSGDLQFAPKLPFTDDCSWLGPAQLSAEGMTSLVS
jgi:hypothetical protein